MYYSHLADINVGITATIWFCCPIWTAIVDYLINGEKLELYHVISMVFLIACGVIISFSGDK